MWLPSQGQFSHVIYLKNGGLGFILQGGSLETHQRIHFTAFAPQMNEWCQLQRSAAQGSGQAGSTGVTPPRWGWILLKVNEILCIVQCNHCSVQQAAQHKGGESFIHIQFLSQSWALIAVLCVRKISTEPPRMDNSALLTLSVHTEALIPGVSESTRLPLCRWEGRDNPVTYVQLLEMKKRKPSGLSNMDSWGITNLKSMEWT